MTTNRVDTVPEVEAKLRMSKNSVYDSIKKGRIPPIRIGKKCLVPGDWVDRAIAAAWAASNTTVTPSEGENK